MHSVMDNCDQAGPENHQPRASMFTAGLVDYYKQPRLSVAEYFQKNCINKND